MAAAAVLARRCGEGESRSRTMRPEGRHERDFEWGTARPGPVRTGGQNEPRSLEERREIPMMWGRLLVVGQPNSTPSCRLALGRPPPLLAGLLPQTTDSTAATLSSVMLACPTTARRAFGVVPLQVLPHLSSLQVPTRPYSVAPSPAPEASIVRAEGGLTFLELNRASAKNALSVSLVDSLRQLVEEVRFDGCVGRSPFLLFASAHH